MTGSASPSPFEPATPDALPMPDPAVFVQQALVTSLLLFILAIIALFWGWRLMLAMTMVALAAIIIGAGHRVLSERLPWAVPLWGQVVLGAVALVVVWKYLRPVHRLLAAVNGFFLLGILAALPGVLLDWRPLTLLGLLVGGVPGAWCGWRFVHHVDAVFTACAGGALLVVGALLCADIVQVKLGLAAWVGLLLLAAVLVSLGIVVQFKQLQRQSVAAGKSTDPVTKEPMAERVDR